MSAPKTPSVVHLSEYIMGELTRMIEREGIDLTTPTETPVWEEIVNTMESVEFGRVAALVSLVEEMESGYAESDIADAERFRRACLPGLLKNKDREPFTVIGTYGDNHQKWADTVWARGAGHAAALVEGGTVTEEPVAVAGVIEGEVAVA